MDFEFSDEQEQLRDSVRRLLAERAPITPYVRERYDAPSIGVDDVWRAIAQLGVTGLLVPEEHGGAGMGMVDAAVVLEELGRAVNPLPYASSAIATVSLVVDAGSAREHASLLPGLADGTAVGTVAVFEPGQRTRWLTPSVTATPDGDVARLSGTKAHVPDAGAATLIVTTAATEGRFGLFAVDATDTGVQVEPVASPDGSRKQASVHFDGARGWPLPTDDAAGAVARMLDRLAAAYVVDGVGAAARALELAVEYAKERVQFDKPIGAFQAVQHLCADMLRVVELGRAAGYYACWALDEAPATEAHRAATMAQAYASDAFAQLGGSAVQVFGGIGFTWEHDIHLFYKRLLSAASALGTTDDHLGELADVILAAG